MVSIRHRTPAPNTGVLPRSAYNEDHDVPIATLAEAVAGTATDKLMTPQSTAQAIAALAGEGGVGPQGPQGEPGPAGPAGPAGATGPAGANGESVTITTFTSEAAFNSATPGARELVVLLDA